MSVVLGLPLDKLSLVDGFIAVVGVDEGLEHRLAFVSARDQPRWIAEQAQVVDVLSLGVPFALLRRLAFLLRYSGLRVCHRAE